MQMIHQLTFEQQIKALEHDGIGPCVRAALDCYMMAAERATDDKPPRMAMPEKSAEMLANVETECRDLRKIKEDDARKTKAIEFLKEAGIKRNSDANKCLFYSIHAAASEKPSQAASYLWGAAAACARAITARDLVEDAQARVLAVVNAARLAARGRRRT